MQVAGVELAGARVLVVGLQRSGLAAIELLRREQAQVTAADSRPLEALGAAGELLARHGIGFTPQSAGMAEGHHLVVISPGVPLDAEPLETARRAGIPVIGELELAGYFLKGPAVAITGSNGKTTVTSMIGHILRCGGVPAQVGGNIGTPPSAMIASSRPDQWNVLEVSSFQAETVSHFRAAIAVGLNLTPDHLDRHHTIEAYAEAKSRIFRAQTPAGVAVLNADDEACVRFAALTPGRTLWFSRLRPVRPGLWCEAGRILYDGRPLLDISLIPLRGTHNVENTLAAVAAALEAGVTPAAIPDAIRTFPGVEHRLEFVARIRGVDYFNDSKATNVDATLKALAAFNGGLWVILGGKDKGSDYRPLRAPLAERARAALLIGAASAKIAAQLEGAVPLIDCGDIGRAVELAAARARPGDTVLLAPACASFDQFQNFEHRGRVFKDIVATLRPAAGAAAGGVSPAD